MQQSMNAWKGLLRNCSADIDEKQELLPVVGESGNILTLKTACSFFFCPLCPTSKVENKCEKSSDLIHLTFPEKPGRTVRSQMQKSKTMSLQDPQHDFQN
ncbi:hypothetical protein STEG23_024351 [Scotinomys teguina]